MKETNIMKPLILFCNSPVAPRKPNEVFENEYQAAKLAGFETILFNDDLAMKKNGQWLVVEVGDGQVSAIPDENFAEFYRALSVAVN